jgi:hypothetical protein
MRIPDFISPMVGWRVWQLDAKGLRSLNGEPWLHGRPLQAGCRVSGARSLPHDAPQFSCKCGIYGSKCLDHLRRTLYWQYGGVHGEVNFWGSVVEHEQGLRAEFAYPRSLYLPSDMLPVTMKKIQPRIQALVGYGCDLFIAHDTSSIPLWRKGSGLDAAGLEFLTSRGEKWYAQRKCDKVLKPGDRVAVLGRGIAVVQEVIHEHVHAILWNRSLMRLQRRKIVWAERNGRWEVNETQDCRTESLLPINPSCRF